ncbi:O-antigen ligase family protein [Rhodopirellula sp.]|nr:O-antigen ligase family protein [Rhodopirellula sp.]
MLGPIFVFGLLAFICVKALQHPAYGIIGFYSFVTLDPVWNWRWSLPEGFDYQNYIVIATFLGWAFNGFRITPQSKMSKWGLTIAFTFYIWSWICTSQSIDPVRSRFFMEYLGKILLLFSIGVLTIDTPKKLIFLLALTLLGQSYNAYQINLDYFQTGFARWAYQDWGSKGVDNNGYQLITLPIIGLALGFFCCTSEPKRKTAYLILAVLMAHQIMLSFSRGAMLGGLTMIPITWLLMPRGKKSGLYLLAGLFIGSVLAGPSVVKEFNTIFADEAERDTSAESRIYLWKAGWRITMDYPMFGTGPDAARRLVASDTYYDGTERSANKALHNLYFDVSTGTGIPGFLLFISLFTLPIFASVKIYKFSRLGRNAKLVPLIILIGLSGYFIGSMFSSGVLFETSYIPILAGYCISNFEHQASSGKIFNDHYPIPVI